MKRAVIYICLCLWLLTGCTREEPPVQADFFAMDTVMQVRVWGREAETAAQQVQTLVEELEKTWSAAAADSVVSARNRGEEVEDPVARQVFAQAEALSARTGGAFDPKLYAVTELWGFPTDAYHVPSAEEVQKALQEEKWDLGAAIKGYAGQQAAQLLAELEVDRAVLNLGGNIQTFGSKPDGRPWQIGIQDPAGGGTVGTLAVEGTATIVTSGSYQRYFEADGVRYHHILDPKTGCPADSGLVSVTVICRDGMTADALSTALFVLGLEDGMALWRQSEDFEAVFLLENGEIYATEGANLSGCSFEVISREE